ncbi:MAG: hypothetical protein ACPLW9_01170 [Minisyncoccales bacterium]
MPEKLITKYFNIHNLVGIKIQSYLRSKIGEVRYHVREFEEPYLSENAIDIFVYDYSECPVFKNSTVLSNYYYYSDNYLNIPAERLCFNFIDFPFVIYCDRFRIPLNFLVELVLLRKGYSLIHAAAVEYRGENYLFPAFGGVGKTTTVASIIFSGGKLFGDDMIIIKGQKIFSYPMDFSVYPYHLDILKIKDKKIKYQFLKTKILNSLTEKLKNYDFKVIKLLILILNLLKVPYVNVSPKKIFGENCIVEKGQIYEIYYLRRTENDTPQIIVESIDSNKLAEICTNTILQEWHQPMAILYTYSGLTSFSLHSLFCKIRDIFIQTFRDYECYQIKIPNNLDNLTYQKQLISLLSNEPKRVFSKT